MISVFRVLDVCHKLHLIVIGQSRKKMYSLKDIPPNKHRNLLICPYGIENQQILVHTVSDTCWRTLAQPLPSTVTADNQRTVDIGIFVHKSLACRSLNSRIFQTADHRASPEEKCHSKEGVPLFISNCRRGHRHCYGSAVTFQPAPRINTARRHTPRVLVYTSTPPQLARTHATTTIQAYTKVKQLLIPITPTAHATKMASLAGIMLGRQSFALNQRLITYQPVGNLSKHVVANQAQGPFPEPLIANQRMGILEAGKKVGEEACQTAGGLPAARRRKPVHAEHTAFHRSSSDHAAEGAVHSHGCGLFRDWGFANELREGLGICYVSCLIGYCVLSKVTYRLDCRLASTIPSAGSRTVYRHMLVSYAILLTCATGVHRVDEVRTEQRRNARAGETVDPQENLPTSSIVPARSPLVKIATWPRIERDSPRWEASSLTAQPPRYPGIYGISGYLSSVFFDLAAIDLEAGVQTTPKVVEGTGEGMLRDGIDSCPTGPLLKDSIDTSKQFSKRRAIDMRYLCVDITTAPRCTALQQCGQMYTSRNDAAFCGMHRSGFDCVNCGYSAAPQIGVGTINSVCSKSSYIFGTENVREFIHLSVVIGHVSLSGDSSLLDWANQNYVTPALSVRGSRVDTCNADLEYKYNGELAFIWEVKQPDISRPPTTHASKMASLINAEDEIDRSRWLRTTNLRVPTLNCTPANTSCENRLVWMLGYIVKNFRIFTECFTEMYSVYTGRQSIMTKNGVKSANTKYGKSPYSLWLRVAGTNNADSTRSFLRHYNKKIIVSAAVKANLVRFPAGSLPGSRMWESCQAMPLVVGFSRRSSATPPPTPIHSGAAPYSPHFTVIGSQDLDTFEQHLSRQLHASLLQTVTGAEGGWVDSLGQTIVTSCRPRYLCYGRRSVRHRGCVRVWLVGCVNRGWRGEGCTHPTISLLVHTLGVPYAVVFLLQRRNYVAVAFMWTYYPFSGWLYESLGIGLGSDWLPRDVKFPCWLDFRLAGKVLGADWRTAFRRVDGQCELLEIAEQTAVSLQYTQLLCGNTVWPRPRYQ
ncbi:hypothetical protein PR048_027263 [Dryococelus australis]|uniref:Uncharacterized protein n=1 Tax=Dryococelus australis TaxID=614101 RepID=A0ABQ9GGL9_9NEOP|nr:hypothetical protein PR048_027263 [Dryococelus australis]